LRLINIAIPPGFNIGSLSPNEETIRSFPKIPIFPKSFMRLMDSWSIIELVSIIVSIMFILNSYKEKLKGNKLEELANRLSELKRTLKRIGGQKTVNFLLNDERIREIMDIIAEYNLEEEIVNVCGSFLGLTLTRLTMLPTPFEKSFSERQMGLTTVPTPFNILYRESPEKGVSKKIPKEYTPFQHFPYVDPIFLWTLILLYSKDKKDMIIEDEVDMARFISEKTIKIYIETYSDLVNKIEENGIEYLRKKWGKFVSSASFLFDSIVLKYVAILGIGGGADIELIQKVSQLGFILEKLAFYEYKGKKEEKKEILLWARERDT
ncbi:MAG: hypothetical protein J7K23_02780, partial [Thermoproteales archaeon]|nr:hypothetical protein [Thermoproteales archaeon]